MVRLWRNKILASTMIGMFQNEYGSAEIGRRNKAIGRRNKAKTRILQKTGYNAELNLYLNYKQSIRG